MHAYVYVCMHDFCFEEMCICAPPYMHTHMHSTYAKMIIVLDVYINLWGTADLQGCRKSEIGLPYLGCHLENGAAGAGSVNMVDIPCLLPYVSYVLGLVCFDSLHACMQSGQTGTYLSSRGLT
jgi:hypothetical protein